jgi:hypothetical protein
LTIAAGSVTINCVLNLAAPEVAALDPGRRLLATEVSRRTPPTDEDREILHPAVCPGSRFDSDNRVVTTRNAT